MKYTSLSFFCSLFLASEAFFHAFIVKRSGTVITSLREEFDSHFVKSGEEPSDDKQVKLQTRIHNLERFFSCWNTVARRGTVVVTFLSFFCIFWFFVIALSLEGSLAPFLSWMKPKIIVIASIYFSLKLGYFVVQYCLVNHLFRDIRLLQENAIPPGADLLRARRNNE